MDRIYCESCVQSIFFLSFYLEPGVCFDESGECQEFARQGKCTNSALHKFANYCKLSCSLCGENYFLFLPIYYKLASNKAYYIITFVRETIEKNNEAVRRLFY